LHLSYLCSGFLSAACLFVAAAPQEERDVSMWKWLLKGQRVWTWKLLMNLDLHFAWKYPLFILSVSQL
jgi:hypothetical protein